MKTRAALVVLLAAGSVASPALAAIDLLSLASGSEGDTRFTDSTPMGIDSSGNGFLDQDPFFPEFFDFDVTGSVADPLAFNTDFDFLLQGMSDVNTTTGASLADGGIDRDGMGRLGIRGGGGSGIDPLEGYLLGIDAADLDPSRQFRIASVGVAFLGDTDFGKIVNRNDPSRSLTFGAVGTGADWEGGTGSIDVTPLGLTVSGGSSAGEIASIFGSAGSGFRFTGFGVDVVPEQKILLDSLGSGSEGNTRFSDTTTIGVDGSGNAFDPTAGNGFEDYAVSGVVAEAGAFSTNFGFPIQGMSNVDLATGAKLADGGIDRAGNGDLGVRGGTGNGIEAREGLLLGINAANLDPKLAYRITDVGLANLGGAETGTIINRSDTSKSAGFAAGDNGFVNVTALGLEVNGGHNVAEIASVFGDDFGEGNFRVSGFKLEVVPASFTEILLSSLATGSEGDTRFMDSTPFSVDTFGTAFTTQQGSTSQDFDVMGAPTEAAAFDTNLAFIIQGLSNVDTASGAKLADGGIDRDSAGKLGIRDGANNGIESLEGFLLGLDATELDPSLGLQITDIRVEFLSGDKAGKIVNRNDSSKSLTFGAVGTGSDFEGATGFIDVTDLDLIVAGGSLDEEIASIFGVEYTDPGGFRITDFKVDFVSISPPSGDYNGDGVVDAADFTVWRDTLGNSVPQGTGADGDNDGMIGIGDYTVWKNNFGATPTSSGAIAAPEPVSATLLLGSAALGVTRRRGSA
ncbi:MAG: hypothetical protein AAGJ46_02310 [Planctomycetota bacterium]